MTRTQRVERLTQELRDQHELLREEADRCLALADRFDRDDIGGDELAAAVFHLRRLLEDHNAFEEEVLPRLLPGLDDDEVIEGVVRAQIAEHHDLDVDTRDATTAGLRVALTRLRDHMIAEDAAFTRLRFAQPLRGRRQEAQPVHDRDSRIR